MEKPRSAKPQRIRQKNGRKLLLLGGVLAFLSLPLLIAWWWPRGGADRPEDDPRVVFATPYRNVHPKVGYMGDDACADCHPAHAETYRQHPMGRSFTPVARAASVERYDQAAHNPFDRSGFHFLIECQGDQVIHRETRRDTQGRVITNLAAQVDFAIGSGTLGRTYLINRDGYLFQSPVSWYSQKGVWDLTPGFDVREHFERPADLQCLFCHTNYAEPVSHSINRYRPPIFRGYAIGCERCHGPGELHVHERENGEPISGKIDYTIVNPRHLPPSPRDAVCEQCHLQGESRVVRNNRQPFEYRPGLPLHLFLSVFVRAPEFIDNPRAGGHAEQMGASRCYQGSGGKLGCISCHDPHAVPAAEKRVAYYRSRCLGCHQGNPNEGPGLAAADSGVLVRSCSLPLPVRHRKSKEDSCIDCHMPRAAARIAHTALTDHRLPRRTEAVAGPANAPRSWLPGSVPLLHYHRNLTDPDDLGVNRDLGLALTKAARDYPQLGRRVAPLALPLLEPAVQRDPGDVAAWEGKGYALWLLDRKEEALAAFDTALAKAPERESTLVYAAVLTGMMGQTDAAIDYWQRALAVDPWPSQYRYQLAKVLAQRQEWPRVAAECETALRLNPSNEPLLSLLVTASLRTGNRERAQIVFDTLLALNRGDQEALRRWFAEQLPANDGR